MIYLDYLLVECIALLSHDIRNVYLWFVYNAFVKICK